LKRLAIFTMAGLWAMLIAAVAVSVGVVPEEPELFAAPKRAEQSEETVVSAGESLGVNAGGKNVGEGIDLRQAALYRCRSASSREPHPWPHPPGSQK